jgi:hypothetical protein
VAPLSDDELVARMRRALQGIGLKSAELGCVGHGKDEWFYAADLGDPVRLQAPYLSSGERGRWLGA